MDSADSDTSSAREAQQLQPLMQQKEQTATVVGKGNGTLAADKQKQERRLPGQLRLEPMLQQQQVLGSSNSSSCYCGKCVHELQSFTNSCSGNADATSANLRLAS